MKNRMNIGRVITVTLVSVCLVIISIAASGCIMEVDETGEITKDPAVVTLNDTGLTVTGEDPPAITVEPLVVKAKRVPMATIEVGTDHHDASFRILDADENVIVDVAAEDCPMQSNFYYVCSVDLAVGDYSVVFDDVDGYESPDSVDIKLTGKGTEVYGSYAEDPDRPEPPRVDVRLPGIGDELAF